jgi:hypothetical protein
MDIAKDGIALWEADERELHIPKPKTHDQVLAMAKGYFEESMPKHVANSRKPFSIYTILPSECIIPSD